MCVFWESVLMLIALEVFLIDLVFFRSIYLLAFKGWIRAFLRERINAESFFEILITRDVSLIKLFERTINLNQTFSFKQEIDICVCLRFFVRTYPYYKKKLKIKIVADKNPFQSTGFWPFDVEF